MLRDGLHSERSITLSFDVTDGLSRFVIYIHVFCGERDAGGPKHSSSVNLCHQDCLLSVDSAILGS